MDVLLPIIRRIIPKSSKTATVQPRLRGFENIRLPTRIAVPSIGQERTDTDESNDIIWLELRKATITEAERNVAMRDAIAEGAQKERDLVNSVVLAARHAGGQDDSVIGVVLNLSRP